LFLLRALKDTFPLNSLARCQRNLHKYLTQNWKLVEVETSYNMYNDSVQSSKTSSRKLSTKNCLRIQAASNGHCVMCVLMRIAFRTFHRLLGRFERRRFAKWCHTL